MPKLTIDPEVDEYEDIVDLVDFLYGRKVEDEDDEDELAESEAVETTEASPATTTNPIEGFTPARMRRYVANLTPEGKQALRYIAEHGPSVEMDDVQAHLGFTPRMYAGRMSTFGHAITRSKGVTRMPFDRHYRTYSIDLRVAKMAIEALDLAS
jgi:hypothetical protein